MNAEPVRSSKYTTEEIERGLLELAVCAGNASRASARLQASGSAIPERTLRQWIRQYAGRYEDVQHRHAREIEGTIIQQARATAALAGEVERRALERTAEALEDGSLRDPAAVARNAAVTKGINVDQVLKLTGRPTQTVEHRQAEDIIARLEKLGVLEAQPTD